LSIALRKGLRRAKPCYEEMREIVLQNIQEGKNLAAAREATRSRKDGSQLKTRT
jgi:hypothetical protein